MTSNRNESTADEKRVIGLIPARGGSKGLPGKNIIDFCGKPLLAWSIVQARDSRLIDRIYVTSDDESILKVAESYHVGTVKRPDELATDTATSEAVLQHAIEVIERAEECELDMVVFLQPTSPLRGPDDIDGAVEKLITDGADSLFSASLLDDYCIWERDGETLKSISFNYLQRGRRQDREPLFLENGSIYVFRKWVLEECNNRLGGKITTYVMDSWKSLEIDTIDDLELCRWYMEKRILNT